MKAKSFVSTVFSPDIFKAIFYIVSILGVCPLVAPVVEPYLKLFHVYAVVVLVFDLFGEQRILKNKGRFLLILFGMCYCVTLLTNPNLINLSGLSNFCYLLAELAIVYSYGKNSEKIDRISSAMICTAISVANLIGIWMFYEKFHLYIPGRGYIGIFPYENRLAGLFGNPNVLGMICLGAICLSCILFCSSGGHKSKVYFGILGCINFITLLLSNSRTQIYSVVFLCVVFVFVQVLKRSRDNKNRFFILSGAVVLTAVLCFAGVKLVQQGLSSFDSKYVYYLHNISAVKTQPSDRQEVTMGPEIQDTTVPSAAEAEVMLSESKEDDGYQTIYRTETEGLNGRVELWLRSLKVIAAKPIFGCGLDNHNYTLRALGHSEIPVKGNLHNVYLEVLSCCGVAGFMCLVIYLLIMLKNVINFFKCNNGASWTLGAMYLASIAAFMLDGAADSTLIASFYPTAVSFWFIASQFANLLEEESLRTGKYQKDLLYRVSERFLNWREDKR